MPDKAASATFYRGWSAFRKPVSKVVVGLFVISLCLMSSGWRERAPLVESLLSLLGWLLIAICVSGRLWSSSYVSGRKNVILQTEGPYSLCRNPLYFFSFLGGLGVSLISETLILPAIYCVVFLAFYRLVILREETQLKLMHGAKFDRYLLEVPRFWPTFSAYHEPEYYEVAANKFRKELMDVSVFVIAGGLTEWIEGLHRSGILPICFVLY